MAFLKIRDTRKRRRIERLRLNDRAVCQDTIAVPVNDDELAGYGMERANARIAVHQKVLNIETAIIIAEDQRLKR